MRFDRSIITVLAVLLLAAPSVVQAGKQGRLVGKVVDLHDHPIPGVHVTATEKAGSTFKSEAVTNKKGVFLIDLPDLGVVYRFRFEKAGYAPFEADLTWNLAGTAHRVFTMHAVGTMEVGTAPLSSTSKEAAAAFNAGVKALKTKDYATAEKEFRAAVKRDPNLRQAWAALSAAHFEQGHYHQAADAAEKAVALGSTDAWLLRTRWEAYRKLGDEAKAAAALEDLKKAGDQTKEAKVLYNDAVKLLKAGEKEAALKEFQEAADLDPKLLRAMYGVADTALELGHYKQAAAAAERILADDPHNEQALRIRYNAYLALGDQDKLVDALVGLASVAPKVARNGLLKLAFDAYDANDWPKAKERFSKFLQLDPDNAVAHYYLGTTELNLGDMEGAKKHLERCVELAPNGREAAPARQILEYLQKH